MKPTLSSVIQAIKQLDYFEMVEAKLKLEELVQLNEHRSFTLNEHLENPAVFDGSCPHCGSKDSKKNGKYKEKNLQRYLCKSCSRSFTAMTGTAVHYIHRKEDFVAYADAILEGDTLVQAADRFGISEWTAHAWRHKYNQSFKSSGKDGYLHGNVQSDEFYVPHSEKGARGLENPRRRGSDRKQRGIGKELVCILAAIGERGGESVELAGLSRLTRDSVETILSPLIRKQRKGGKRFFCTDGSKAFPPFVKKKGLILEVIKTAEKTFITETGAHFQKVANIQMRFRKWMRRFNGVASKYLEGYLHQFRILNKFKNFKERFQALIRLTLSRKDVFIPYGTGIKNFYVKQQNCLV